MSVADDSDTDQVLDPARQEALEDGQLRGEFVQEVREALEEGDEQRVQELAEPLHNADIADLIEQFAPSERPDLAAALGDQLSPEVIAEMDDEVREDLVDLLPPEVVASVLSELDTDDAVAIVEDLDEEDQKAVLRALTADDRAALEEALGYPEESAGRLMQRDLIAVPQDWDVGQVIDFLRAAETDDLTEEFWEIFVVDARHHPVGTLKLSHLLRAPRPTKIADIMLREQTLVPVDMDQEEVALRFQKYALISAAVVDDAERLVGMITVDDIVHVVRQEADEDFRRLTGAEEGGLNERTRDIVRQRLRWLVINLGTAVAASIVIGVFSDTIEQIIALAILMPIVASLGGNAATQTMAVTVRALATDELTVSNTGRTIVKELRVALINGVAIAALIGIAAGVYFAQPLLGVVIAAAMLGNIVIAGLAGLLIPILLDRADIDPAISSSVFVTMTTDVMGFLLFLGLATAVLL
ncbi:magnesium transporter [Pacificimonas flava]|uniref:Magnesium transporter MgtE n=2 Tax=Pacificimonas TaxID=1960290 RepID=A0A219B656_9SPHN|nr:MULTISPECIES: magnesium transporter [Pacificimonas]MBZ6378922.1 magnesium transporter [Pacificimonas aurantium]OWV33827.1 magnesium transporter [Pacificimonas flava]